VKAEEEKEEERNSWC